VVQYEIGGCIIYSPEESKIFKTDHSTSSESIEHNFISLDNLENVVLTLLVENPNKLTSYATFLEKWRSPEVSDSAISRVVSLVRTKLSKLGLDKTHIQNTTKRGYTLMCNVIVIETLPREQNKKIIADINGPKKLRVGAAIFLLFMFSAWWLFNSAPLPQPKLTISRTVEILENELLKIEFAFNPTNKLLAYSTKKYQDEYWEVHVVNIDTNEVHVVAKSNRSVRKPSWLNDRELMVRAYNNDVCQFELIQLNLEGDNYKSETNLNCNHKSFASSISHLSKNKILFTESELNDITSHLYVGNIKSGKINKVLNNDNGGLGYYYIASEKSSNYIVLLSSADGTHTTIKMVQKDSWQTVWEEKLVGSLFSVSWDGNYLSHKDQFGGITVKQFDDGELINKTSIPILAPIYNVTSAGHKGEILFSKGELFGQNIELTNMLDSNSTKVISKNNSAKNHSGKFINENLFIYASNKTGIEQLWAYNLVTDVSYQISSFEQSQAINNISVSTDSKYIAVEFAGEISVYQLTPNNQLSEKTYQITGYNPTFYRGETLLYSKYNGEESRLHSVDLGTKVDGGITIEGAYEARISGENLYYSKLFFSGIWLFKEFGEDELILPLNAKLNKWYVNNNELYYEEQDNQRKVFRIDTGDSVLFPAEHCTAPVDIKGQYCASAITHQSLSNIMLVKLASK